MYSAISLLHSQCTLLFPSSGTSPLWREPGMVNTFHRAEIGLAGRFLVCGRRPTLSRAHTPTCTTTISTPPRRQIRPKPGISVRLCTFLQLYFLFLRIKTACVACGCWTESCICSLFMLCCLSMTFSKPWQVPVSVSWSLLSAYDKIKQKTPLLQ